MNAGWLWKNIRYAILLIFVIAAIITPTPDVLTMCVFAAPMLVLYLVSIGVAYMVHPSRRNRLQKHMMIFRRISRPLAAARFSPPSPERTRPDPAPPLRRRPRP